MPRMDGVSNNEVVFEFDPDERPMWAVRFTPQRTYAQAVKGKGYRSFEPHGNAGMCMSMVCNWVKRSSANGGNVANLAALGDLHLVAITHSAYRRHGADVLGIYGVKEMGLDGEDQDAAIDVDATVARVIDWPQIVRTQTFFALYMTPNSTTNAAGHVVGMKSGPAAWAYFDPNYGLYNFASRARLVEILTQETSWFFGMLNQRFNGGTWSISQLEMA
jgi:hypothetical protein